MIGTGLYAVPVRCIAVLVLNTVESIRLAPGVGRSSGRGSNSKVTPSGLGHSGLSSALSSSGTTPRSLTPGGAPTSASMAAKHQLHVPLRSPMPEPPDEDLATWQVIQELRMSL